MKPLLNYRLPLPVYLSLMIHYKFKSAASSSRKWDSIGLEGAVVSVLDLKRSIVQQKKLAKSNVDFDLMITNAQTGEGPVSSFFTVPPRLLQYIVCNGGNKALICVLCCFGTSQITGMTAIWYLKTPLLSSAVCRPPVHVL